MTWIRDPTLRLALMAMCLLFLAGRPIPGFAFPNCQSGFLTIAFMVWVAVYLR